MTIINYTESFSKIDVKAVLAAFNLISMKFQ